MSVSSLQIFWQQLEQLRLVAAKMFWKASSGTSWTCPQEWSLCFSFKASWETLRCCWTNAKHFFGGLKIFNVLFESLKDHWSCPLKVSSAINNKGSWRSSFSKVLNSYFISYAVHHVPSQLLTYKRAFHASSQPLWLSNLKFRRILFYQKELSIAHQNFPVLFLKCCFGEIKEKRERKKETHE